MIARTDWVKLSRNLINSPIWMAEPFTRGQAWVDLLLHASHSGGFFYVRGIKVPVARGQVAMSQLTMAERWQWSRGKVRRFVSDLISEGMAVQQTVQPTSVLTLCNFDIYQSTTNLNGTPNSTANGTADGTADGQQTVHIQEGKEGKKVKKGPFRPPSLLDVKRFFNEAGAGQEAEKFHDHYTGNGWKVSGRAPMKDWQATARNWIRRSNEPTTQGNTHGKSRQPGRQGTTAADILATQF